MPVALSLLCLVGVQANSRRTDFSQEPGLRSAAAESKTSSFNEMIVRHAKRLCNGGFYKVFSQDARDFIEFWRTASETNLDVEKAYTCMRLFFNNNQKSELVDYTTVEQTLTVMPQLFEKYFETVGVANGEFRIIQESVEDLLLKSFTEQMNRFQSEPDVFLNKISLDVVDIVKSRLTMIRQEREEIEFKEKLRNIVIRFIDSMLNKLIWYEDAYQSIWPSFIGIGDKLHVIGTRGIINDQDNLDELWNTLVTRFCWFLDFKGSVLPVEFFEQIEEDLKNNIVFFLEVEEQDKGIKSKKEILAEAVLTAKAKALAYEKANVITDQDYPGH